MKETITEFIKSKEIEGINSDLNIAGGEKEMSIKGGVHTIDITSHVHTLHMYAGKRIINIKSSLDNLIIDCGVSEIYIFNIGDSKVNNIDIIGGNHKIMIYSYVNELKILGGISEIYCNFQNSKINKISTIGGQREIYLNENTEKAELDKKGGTCNIHKTEIKKEPKF